MRAIQMIRPEAGAAALADDLEPPTPTAGEVRVKVARTAICGTDRHIYHWDPSVTPMLQPPVIIGHEFCGHIESLGEGVEGWEVGDYVSAEMHLVCWRCRACRAGNQHVCERTRIAGLHRDGCFAEFVVVPSTNLVRLNPDVVSPEIGSFLDALGNAVHTVQSATSIAGRHVLVSGYGAIGAMAAAVVAFEGAKSLTITEVAPGHLERARKWANGLDSKVPIHILDPKEEGPHLVQEIRDRTDGGVDVVLEMSGAPMAIHSCMSALYPGGEMMQLGIPAGSGLEMPQFTQDFIFRGLRWQGILGRRMFATWEEMLSLLERGLKLDHIVTHRMPLDGFHEGIALLDRAEAHKVVLDPSA